MPKRVRRKLTAKKAASIKDLSDEALFCQAFVFHRCEPYVPPPGLFGRPEFGYREVQICRCGTIRHRLYSRVTGEALQKGWSYIHQDLYKAEGPTEREENRKEYFKRQSRKSRNGNA